jgi:hypothetical protein
VVQLYDGRPGATLQIASGDLNAEPGSTTLAALTGAGFVDTWLLAGQPECDASTGSGCTGGRDSPETDLDGLDVPDGHYARRIDFVLGRAGTGCNLTASADPLFAEPLEEPVEGLYWPSDHAGLVVELRCAPA